MSSRHMVLAGRARGYCAGGAALLAQRAGGAAGGAHEIGPSAGGVDASISRYDVCFTFSVASLEPVEPVSVQPAHRRPPRKVSCMPEGVGESDTYSHALGCPNTGAPADVTTCAQKQSSWKALGSAALHAGAETSALTRCANEIGRVTPARVAAQ